MIENNFVASLRSDGAFGSALVFKLDGQYCMCSLSHGVAPHGASPLNHRRTGTLICPVCAKDALVAYWHLTNMFSSHGARHTPHLHVRTQLFSKFHSHLSALVLRACGSATWSVRTSSTKKFACSFPEGHISANLSHCHPSALLTGISRSFLLAGRALFHVRVRRASEQHAHTQVRQSTSSTTTAKVAGTHDE